jgi:hypothetical protein
MTTADTPLNSFTREMRRAAARNTPAPHNHETYGEVWCQIFLSRTLRPVLNIHLPNGVEAFSL